MGTAPATQTDTDYSAIASCTSISTASIAGIRLALLGMFTRAVERAAAAIRGLLGTAPATQTDTDYSAIASCTSTSTASIACIR